MNYICNVKSSPFDKRDYEYIGIKNIEIKINLPNIIDYRDQLLRVRDQGNQGTCFAQSVACVKEWQERKDYGFENYFSPQFFYNNRFNKYDNKLNNDNGMYGRDVMKLMKKVGICSESSYPYGRIEDKKFISNKIYKEAKNHIIKGYARIYKLGILKEALYNNGPCIITFPVYNYGNTFWKGIGKHLGGHAVTIVGYNEEGLILRNSWGKEWGNDGYWLYKYENWGQHWEIWTTIDEKSNYIKYEEKKKCCLIS